MNSQIIKISTFICLLYVTVCGQDVYKRKCHNFYYHNQRKCDYKIYNSTYANVTVICELCTEPKKKYLLTICNTTEFHISVEDILNVISDKVEYLLINLDNTWNGFLPLEPRPINISAISRFHHLRHFQISDNKLQYYQLYPISINISALEPLKKLKTLRIRIPIIDDQKVNISQMIQKLRHLQYLDLSYTRGLGIKTITEIFEKLNNTNIKHLCLRKFQLPGAKGYAEDFTEVVHNFLKMNLIFPKLEELDISDNTIAFIPPGISRVFPKLKALDISGNSLLDSRNMALLLELILHPQIVLLNANYQGCEQQPSNYIPSIDLLSPLSMHGNNEDYLKESQNYNKESKDSLEKEQTKFLINCMNHAGVGNISHVFKNKTSTCKFMKCILPSLFADLVCKNANIVPVSTIYNHTCIFNIKIPIGQNLKSIKFSYVHLEQARTIGAKVTGILCFGENNLTELYFDDNSIWMESAQFDRSLKALTGSLNLNKLEKLSFSNNNVKLKFGSYATGLLPNLQYLNLSGNIVHIHVFCQADQNLEILDLSRANITTFHPNAFQNCKRLRKLYLGINDINASSLNFLDFSKIVNFTYLDLKNTKIHRLPCKFLFNLEKLPNKSIDLSNNPLSCNCSEESKKFTLWLRKNNKLLINYTNYYCSGPDGLTFISNIKNINTFWDSCDENKAEYIILSVVSTIAIIALIGMLISLYRVRWRLHYLLYKLQPRCSLRRQNGKKQLWRYDAFVSYCAEDRFWVHDTFMKKLEETYGFRLCIHYRDFPVGGDIAETISERMSESREIIIIISDIAIKSEWCQFELDEALLQVHRRSQKLIVINLGKIKSKLLNSKVAHILDNHTFLEWSENGECESKHKIFWNTLVGRLYNDPYGQWLCCCAYGAKSLGYSDLINPADGDITVCDEEENDLSNFPTEVQDCRMRALTLKRKAKQAKNFLKTLEDVLKDEDLPHWAYGPTPWPIDQLLQDDKHKFDDQIYSHANERVKLLIECLSEQQSILKEQHRKMMEEFENMKQSYICGENN